MEEDVTMTMEGKCVFCGGEVEEVTKDKCQEWKEGLECFCKVMGIKEFGGDVEELGRLPGCPQCIEKVGEVARLQRRIEEMKASQLELVDKLKESLRSSGSLKNGQLTWATRLPEKPEVKRRPRQCSVVLKRVSPSTKSTTEETEVDTSLMSFLEVTTTKQRRLGNRKSKVKARRNLKALKEPSRSPSPCDNDNDNCHSDDDHFREDSDDLTQPQKSSKEKKGRPALVTNIPYFLKLQDNLLLYKFTLIKIVTGEGLYCDEGECDHFTIAKNVDFDSLELIKEHIETCHVSTDITKYSEKLRTCPLCQKEVGKGLSFRQHLDGKFKCHGNLSYMCQCCAKPVRGSHTMKNHLNLHQSPNLVEPKDRKSKPNEKWSCTDCGKIFGNKENLKAHYKRVHIPKALQAKKNICPDCNELLSSPAALRGHIERKHRPDLQRFKYCPICNKQFNYRAGFQLKMHVRMHTNDKPFICGYCGHGFVSQYLLSKHEKGVHETKERVYQCEFCTMNYRHRKNLQRHRRKQHRERLSEEELKNEEMWKVIHSKKFIGPRIAYPCPVCEKVFELRSRMTKHLKVSHGP